MIRTLNLVNSMDLKQGGPPEVIRNLKKNLDQDQKKIISVMSLDRLRTTTILKLIFIKKQDLNFLNF